MKCLLVIQSTLLFQALESGSSLTISRSTQRAGPFALFAKKPPPTSFFDLQLLEAYEEELDKNDRNSVDLDEEDILELDLDNNETVETKSYVVPPELSNKRVDTVIASFEKELSRSFCGNLVTSGRVVLISEGGNERIDRKSVKLQEGQEIQIRFPAEEINAEIIAQDLPLDILYEDEYMIVINKAANMVVHPASGNWDGTVVNALAFHLSRKSSFGSGDFVDVDGVVKASAAESVKDIQVDGTDGEAVSFRPGIVHRLDKGTTGVLVVAKTTTALATLSEAFAARKVKKTYLCISVGNPGKGVTIDKPIGRHPLHRQRMRVVPDPHTKDSRGLSPKDRLVAAKGSLQTGRRALSFIETLAFDGKLSLVEVRIATGRTHQIRVHLEHRHTPIYGDEVYGLADWNKRLSKTHQIERPLLHAYKLELEHPVTGERMTFKAPMPDDMRRVARAIHPEGEKEMPDIFSVNEDS